MGIVLIAMLSETIVHSVFATLMTSPICSPDLSVADSSSAGRTQISSSKDEVPVSTDPSTVPSAHTVITLAKISLSSPVCDEQYEGDLNHQLLYQLGIVSFNSLYSSNESNVIPVICSSISVVLLITLCTFILILPGYTPVVI